MSLGKYIAEIIIEPTPKKVALYPGAFKPPHRGHFELVQRLSKVADEVLIVISPIARDGITAQQSLSAWKLYLPLLPKAKVIISNVASPVSYVYDYIKSNPQQDIVVAFGKGEEERYKALLNKEKYSNVKVYDAGNIDDLSASNLRNAINSNNPAEIAKFLPQDIEVADYVNALGINLRTEPPFNSIAEEGSLVKKAKTPKGQFLKNWGIDMYALELARGLEENTTPDLTFDQALTSLTQYFVKQGFPVNPLPKVIINDKDQENASKLLGKTAYYDPNKKEITLFTLGRHPKDILRSFAHEMIHHIQNMKGQIHDVDTTDTTSNDYLSHLEQEAYTQGNMTFRNWEDKIKNNKVMNEEKEKSKYTIFCDMDGVLVDFDKGYEDLTGLHTKHADVQDNKVFWNKFKQSLGDKNMTEYDYWAKLDWMPDGKELWKYIKQYNPYILTAPSLNPESKEGKKAWVTRLDNMKNIYFRPAQYKSDFSNENRILIDDRADTIERWNAKGGIGILHTSAADTIKQLKKLGL
jgi:nicotinamide mononucleotide adenylyltransferase